MKKTAIQRRRGIKRLTLEVNIERIQISLLRKTIIIILLRTYPAFKLSNTKSLVLQTEKQKI